MIKNYLDLIEWIRSPRNKKKEYSITLFQSTILQRLIKYSIQNQEITYSNQIISEHMFRGLSQIENNLPILTKKNLITTKVYRPKDEQGNIISKRVIRINWERLLEIKKEMDQFLYQGVEDGSIQLKEKESDIQIEIEPEEQYETKDGITYLEKNGKSYLVKNNQNIYMRYLGVGSQLSLYYLNKEKEKVHYSQTFKKKFKKYLESSGKEFKELTYSDLIKLS